MFKQIFELFKSNSLYDKALKECHEMLDIDLVMFNYSIDSLRKKETAELPMDLYDMDKKINEFERDVRRKIMTHLAISGSTDLGSGLVLVSVVIDIERIGDYTKNIYDMARNHPAKLTGGSIEKQIQLIEKNSSFIFEKGIKAFKEQNIQLARNLMQTYKKDVSSLCDEVTHNIISGKLTDLSTDQGASLALYSRYLKRIAAHSRNLISSVVNPFERIGYPE
ncbi:MAG: PhoU domain-containing protein [Fidelibacterota bacterium]